jgi:hypothetical protein
LTRFKAYNNHGRIGINVAKNVTYCVSRAVAHQLKAKSIVAGMTHT